MVSDKNIYCKPIVPPIVSDTAFTNYHIYLYVPEESCEAYSWANEWENFYIIGTDFSNIISIEKVYNIWTRGNHIYIDSMCDEIKISIYDFNGIEIYNGRNNCIDVCKAGLYFVKINDNVVKIWVN